MSEKAKKAFVVEIIAIVLSLLPLLLYFVVPTYSPAGTVYQRGTPEAERYEPDRILFIAQACIYIAYPLIAVLAGFIFTFVRFEWYLAILAAPLSFLFSAYIVVGHANLTALGITFPVVLLYACLYAALGAIIAWPTAKLRAKRAARDEKVYNDGRMR